MALEAVCFQQELFGCTMKELCSTGGGIWSYDFGGCGGMEEREEKEVLPLISETGGGGGGGGHDCHGIQGNWDSSCSTLVQNFDDWDVNNTSSSPEAGAFADGAMLLPGQDAATGRRKRRRTKSPKNKEEVENQRMTHIAVERNRRKQMNEYLAVLRSLMPASYVQRGDQASIIGGAINFVKELEQLVQSLEAQKQIKQRSDAAPFADFFTFPQYSSSTNTSKNPPAGDDSSSDVVGASANRSSVADIEVTMVESHANLKVLSRRQPKQLLKLVVGLQSLWLTTLHLNVTTINEMVLYSFSLKVEDECQLTTVDEIAHAVHQMVQRFQDAAAAAME